MKASMGPGMDGNGEIGEGLLFKSLELALNARLGTYVDRSCIFRKLVDHVPVVWNDFLIHIAENNFFVDSTWD